MIRYNKLYRSLKKVSGEWHAGNLQWYFSWHYLKFYDDGMLISSSSRGEPKEMSWFNRETVKEYFGKYVINQSRIDGSINASVGEISFSGIINETEIIIKLTNSAMSFQEWDYFEMVEE